MEEGPSLLAPHWKGSPDPEPPFLPRSWGSSYTGWRLGGSGFNREEDPVPEERSVRKGSEAQEEGCPLKKTPSALDGPTAAKQLLAFHAAHLVVVVPSKFGPSPDSPTKNKRMGCEDSR